MANVSQEILDNTIQVSDSSVTLIDNLLTDEKELSKELGGDLVRHLSNDVIDDVIQLESTPETRPDATSKWEAEVSSLIVGQAYPKTFTFPSEDELANMTTFLNGKPKTCGLFAGEIMSILFTQQEEICGRIEATSSKTPEGRVIYYTQLCPKRTRIVALCLTRFYPENTYFNANGTYTKYFKNMINNRCWKKSQINVNKSS